MLLPLKSKGKCGFVDINGRWQIPPQFEDAAWIEEGRCLVKVGSHYACIDENGKLLFPLEYDSIGPFYKGVAQAKRGGQWLLINWTGAIVAEIKADHVELFMEDMAAIAIGGRAEEWYYRGGKWGYIDINGREVIPPRFSRACHFSEGLAEVEDGSSRGYINPQGNLVLSLPPGTRTAGWFSEGLAAVHDSFDTWCYIDKSGRVRIASLPFVSCDAFCEHRAIVMVAGGKSGKEPKFGCIDIEGRVVIRPSLDCIYSFHRGVAAFQAGTGWGFMDLFGNQVIPPRFDYAGCFNISGLARAREGKSGGYIDMAGKWVVKAESD